MSTIKQPHGSTPVRQPVTRNNHGITRGTYREISTAVANAINYKRRGDDQRAVHFGNRVVHLLQYHGML